MEFAHRNSADPSASSKKEAKPSTTSAAATPTPDTLRQRSTHRSSTAAEGKEKPRAKEHAHERDGSATRAAAAANHHAETKSASAEAATKKKDAHHFTVDAEGQYIFPDAIAFQNFVREEEHKYKELQHHHQLGEKKHKLPKKKIYYIYKSGVFECSDFAEVHPGGAALMEDCNGKDITTIFNDSYGFHGHSESALNMLLQLKIGRILNKRSAKEGQLGEFENYQLEELTAYPKITKDEIVYRDFTLKKNEGLVWQAMFLPLDKYFHLINTPIYIPNFRLFKYDCVEFFSRTKFYIIAVLWLPLSLFWTLRGTFRDYTQTNAAWGSWADPYLYRPNRFVSYPAALDARTMSAYIPPEYFERAAAHALTAADNKTIAQLQFAHAQAVSRFSYLHVALVWLLGVLLWTFMEYNIHRFIFHFERAIPATLMDNPLCKYVHLLLHGIHHIIPVDPDRLVFPPVMFVGAAYVIYNAYGLLFNGSLLDILAGGVVFGYVCYDEIHYYIHHADPQDFYFKDLKKFHHAHHYVDDTKGYGISSKLWDVIMGTACEKK